MGLTGSQTLISFSHKEDASNVIQNVRSSESTNNSEAKVVDFPNPVRAGFELYRCEY